MLVRFLPYNAKQWFYEKEQLFYILFLIIWITGLAGVIISPVLNGAYNGVIWLAKLIFRV